MDKGKDKKGLIGKNVSFINKARGANTKVTGKAVLMVPSGKSAKQVANKGQLKELDGYKAIDKVRDRFNAVVVKTPGGGFYTARAESLSAS